MKRIIVIAEIILLGIAGCGGEKQTTDDLITHVSHLSFAPFAPLGAEYRQKRHIFPIHRPVGTKFNGDFSNRKHVGIGAPVSSEISFWQRLEAYELVETYGKGELKGKLKEIAAGLHSESNPVIMLVKEKK